MKGKHRIKLFVRESESDQVIRCQTARNENSQTIRHAIGGLIRGFENGLIENECYLDDCDLTPKASARRKSARRRFEKSS